MDQLELDIAIARGHARLALTLAVGTETVVLVGPSGAGKTTLLRAIAGLERPQRGTIAIGGRRVFDAAAGIDRPPQERGVGMVFQDLALFPHLTVAQNVGYGGGDPAPLLDRFGIAHLAGQSPARLSGGERRRVAVARAVARRPAVLLMDEPMSGLDALTRRRMRTELENILATLGVPTVVVSHDFADAVALADRVGVLIDGALRQIGSPAELRASPADPMVAALCSAEPTAP